MASVGISVLLLICGTYIVSNLEYFYMLSYKTRHLIVGVDTNTLFVHKCGMN